MKKSCCSSDCDSDLIPAFELAVSRFVNASLQFARSTRTTEGFYLADEGAVLSTILPLATPTSVMRFEFRQACEL